MTLRQKVEWKTKREVKETGFTQPQPPHSGLVQPVMYGPAFVDINIRNYPRFFASSYFFID
jgi:hypothetical protein